MSIHLNREDDKYTGFLIITIATMIVFGLVLILSNINILDFLFKGFINGLIKSLIFVVFDWIFYVIKSKLYDINYWVVVFNPIIALPLAYSLIDTPYIMYGYLTGIILILLGNLIIHFKGICKKNILTLDIELKGYENEKV